MSGQEMALPGDLENVTAPNGGPMIGSGAKNVADAEWDKGVRIIVLWIQISLGVIGGVIVITWLWINRRRKSRVNVILIQVTSADLLVMVASLCQVVWEMMDRWWLAGDAFCRIIKFYQSFTMLASSNMLVMLSFDRHQAIRSPLRDPPKVWKMALISWSLAAVMSMPMFFLFHTTHITDEESIFHNKTVCESVFRYRPISHRRAFLTFVAIMHVFLPCLLICACYTRIYLKVAQKAHESTSGVSSTKPGKVHLQSTSSSLPKAKIKTLKMTVVIVCVFLLCGLPYHIMELLFNFWKHNYIPKVVTAIMGALPVANSVINPYIFLAFNVNYRCLKGVIRPKARRPYLESKTENTLNSHGETTAVSIVKYTDYTSDVDGYRSHGNVSNSGGKKRTYLPMTSVGNSGAYQSRT